MHVAFKLAGCSALSSVLIMNFAQRGSAPARCSYARFRWKVWTFWSFHCALSLLLSVRKWGEGRVCGEMQERALGKGWRACSGTLIQKEKIGRETLMLLLLLLLLCKIASHCVV